MLQHIVGEPRRVDARIRVTLLGSADSWLALLAAGFISQTFAE